MKLVFLFFVTFVFLFLLYIFSLKGRIGNKQIKYFINKDYAHRGLHRKPDIPENSLTAFRLAAEQGYGVEFDVHLLKDKNVAIIHDSSLIRTTGSSAVIENLNTGDLKNYYLEGTNENIPTLEEALKIFENNTPLLIELKTFNGNAFELCQKVCNILENHNVKYCIESFDPRCLWWFKKHKPEIIRGQLSLDFIRQHSGLIKILDFILTALVFNFLTKPDFIAYKFEHRKNLSNHICLKLWKLQGFSWTIKNQKNYNIAKKEGFVTIFENINPKSN